MGWVDPGRLMSRVAEGGDCAFEMASVIAAMSLNGGHIYALPYRQVLLLLPGE